ncbi:hypothetical protein [Mumia zhuanghuii]|uniref:hypothetical protein n=1 Tax=Mumia zhuanghuii TaxID=2585211 RepID=UPI001E2CF6C2|nr:hypothetical protein [Mumia zhuanghuii]
MLVRPHPHPGPLRGAARRLARLHIGRDERGDVPGWVLIVVMSAGLVAGLTAVAGPQLRAMLESALSSVGG